MCPGIVPDKLRVLQPIKHLLHFHDEQVTGTKTLAHVCQTLDCLLHDCSPLVGISKSHEVTSILVSLVQMVNSC